MTRSETNMRVRHLCKYIIVLAYAGEAKCFRLRKLLLFDGDVQAGMTRQNLEKRETINEERRVEEGKMPRKKKQKNQTDPVHVIRTGDYQKENTSREQEAGSRSVLDICQSNMLTMVMPNSQRIRTRLLESVNHFEGDTQISSTASLKPIARPTTRLEWRRQSDVLAKSPLSSR